MPAVPPSPDSKPADLSPPRPATLREILGAVFWGFFGVRKGKAMRRDVATIRPHQVILVGIVCAAVLVATLVIIVRLITRG